MGKKKQDVNSTKKQSSQRCAIEFKCKFKLFEFTGIRGRCLLDESLRQDVKLSWKQFSFPNMMSLAKVQIDNILSIQFVNSLFPKYDNDSFSTESLSSSSSLSPSLSPSLSSSSSYEIMKSHHEILENHKITHSNCYILLDPVVFILTPLNYTLKRNINEIFSSLNDSLNHCDVKVFHQMPTPIEELILQPYYFVEDQDDVLTYSPDSDAHFNEEELCWKLNNMIICRDCFIRLSNDEVYNVKNIRFQKKSQKLLEFGIIRGNITKIVIKSIHDDDDDDDDSNCFEKIEDKEKKGEMSQTNCTPLEKKETYNSSILSNPKVSDVSFIASSDTDKLKNFLRALIVSTQSRKNQPYVLKKNTGGALIYGVPGVGKTYSVRHVCKMLNLPLLYINFGSLMDSQIPETVLQGFKRAMQFIEQSKRHVVLFLDEIDVLSSSVLYLNPSLSSLCTIFDQKHDMLIVIGATNNISKVQAVLRKQGRFQTDFSFFPPSEEERRNILCNFISQIFVDRDKQLNKLFPEDVISQIAQKTTGFVIGDFRNLLREACIAAIRNQRQFITADDFLCNIEVSSHWEKSNMENIIAKNANQKDKKSIDGNGSKKMTWDDVGGLEDVKLRLKKSAEWPLLHKKSFDRLGLSAPRGILMFGPPGCAKTSLVKILAATTNRTFLHMSSASVFSPYLGDAEKFIRQIFSQARLAQPSVIFIDEMDSLVGKRDFGVSGGSSGAGGVEKRVLSTLLNEMDGVEATKDVLVIGATNRPDMIDLALLRPGRLDHLIYIPPPDEKARYSILCIHSKQMFNDAGEKESVLRWVASKTSLYSGADLESLCREAALTALRKNVKASQVTKSDFEDALSTIKSSITLDMIQHYHAFEINFYKRS